MKITLLGVSKTSWNEWACPWAFDVSHVSLSWMLPRVNSLLIIDGEWCHRWWRGCHLIPKARSNELQDESFASNLIFCIFIEINVEDISIKNYNFQWSDSYFNFLVGRIWYVKYLWINHIYFIDRPIKLILFYETELELSFGSDTGGINIRSSLGRPQPE